VRPRIALLPWGDVIEDFLDAIGLSLEDLRDRYTGGWLFGYVDALAQAGVDTVIVCVSRRVRRVEHWRHQPTDAELLMLPEPRLHRLLRRSLADPYAWEPAAAAARRDRAGRLRARVALPLAPYVSTPIGTLTRELESRPVAAVLCQDYEYARFDACVLARRRLGAPVFATFQGGSVTRPGIEGAVRSRTMAAARGFVVGPEREAERIQRAHGVPPERIARIPNPVDPVARDEDERLRQRRELGFAPGTVVIAWHGRVAYELKGLDVLLDAWQALSGRPGLPDMRLLLVGTGADAGRLRHRLAEAALSDVVWIDRYLTDRAVLAGLLGAADVYAFPSRHEGFPVGPLEAMAAGLPVVASDVDGVAEIFPAGKSDGGLIVPSGDVAALTGALAALVADASRRTDMGERARRRVASAFSAEAVGRELRRVLLAERHGD
jgi:starch synthase